MRVSCHGDDKTQALPSAAGVGVTRHPVSVLHSNLAVAVGEPVETRAATKKKSFAIRLLPGNRRLTDVNLLIPLAR